MEKQQNDHFTGDSNSYVDLINMSQNLGISSRCGEINNLLVGSYP